MKTYTLKAKDIDKRWRVFDAEGQTLGRLATEIAIALRGKDKPTFTPHLDMGDFVIVTNAAKVKLTGQKIDPEALPAPHRLPRWPQGGAPGRAAGQAPGPGDPRRRVGHDPEGPPGPSADPAPQGVRAVLTTRTRPRCNAGQGKKRTEEAANSVDHASSISRGTGRRKTVRRARPPLPRRPGSRRQRPHAGGRPPADHPAGDRDAPPDRARPDRQVRRPGEGRRRRRHRLGRRHLARHRPRPRRSSTRPSSLSCAATAC